jgi:hypothetical protein
MDLNLKVTFLDTIFAQKIDDEMILLDTNSKNYFALDKMGSIIWHTMREHEKLSDVYNILLQQYEVEPEVLRDDLVNFVKNLDSSGLVYIK